MDFTLKTYCNLLDTLLRKDFLFQTFAEFISEPATKCILLRHDVDKVPENSLAFARIQNNLGIKGSYYFRTFLQSRDEDIINKIFELGHEIGYHYEDLNRVFWQHLAVDRKNEYNEKVILKEAIESFEENLNRLRKLIPVLTICMHGSPMSKWDNRLLWKNYNYRDYGIIGEPYFNLDFSEMLYLTDTGRRWNGDKFNIRDKLLEESNMENRNDYYRDWKVKPIINSAMQMSNTGVDFQNRYNFNSTSDIMKAADESRLPPKIMMTFHPQRWTNHLFPWIKELVWQNFKNFGKYFLIKIRNQ